MKSQVIRSTINRLNQLRKQHSKPWLFLALPFVALVTIVVSIGPSIQKGIFASLTSDKSNIYEAIYSNSIARFPSISEWLLGSINWYPLSIAIIAVAIALRSKSLKQILISLAAWLAIALTLGDVALALLDGKLDGTAMAINVVANLLGAIILAAYSGFSLLAFRAVLRSRALPLQLGRACGAALLVILGVTASIGCYAALRFFYHPLHSRVSIIFGPPTSGAYWTDNKLRNSEEKSDGSRFSFIPNSDIEAGISVRSSKGTPRIEWQRAVDARQYDIQIWLMEDCSFKKIGDLTPGRTFVEKRDAKTVQIEFDEGGAELLVDSGKRRTIAFTNGAPTFFWWDSGESGSGIKSAQFTVENDSIRLSSSEKITLKFGAPLLGAKDKIVTDTPRNLSIRVDGKEWRGLFERPPLSDPGRLIKCQPLELPPPSFDGNSSEATIGGNEVAVLMTIAPSVTPGTYYREQESTLTSSGMSGYLNVTPLTSADLKAHSGGRLTFFHGQGNIGEFDLDGARQEVRPADTLTLLGEMRGEFIENSQIRVSGQAHTAWKSSERLNATRWERLPSDWQLALLSGFLALIGAICAALIKLWPSLRAVFDEHPRDWMSPYR